jgi:hypothetical protein
MSAAATTFDKAKAALGFERWHDRKLLLGQNALDVARTFVRFAPYLVSAYNCLFLETELGPALVTCISEQGVRIEYFSGPHDRGYEWIAFLNGVAFGRDNEPRVLVKQPPRI